MTDRRIHPRTWPPASMRAALPKNIPTITRSMTNITAALGAGWSTYLGERVTVTPPEGT
jgi:hypothetical protein